MKAIYRLFVCGLLSLPVLWACSDGKDLDDGSSTGDNISPVSSFSVETTGESDELLVKWTNPINRDLDMVEISYKDVSDSLTTRASFSPGCITLPAESGVMQEYLLTVPYYAVYEVSAVAISKSGQRSVVESKRLTPYKERGGSGTAVACNVEQGAFVYDDSYRPVFRQEFTQLLAHLVPVFRW